VPWRRGPAPPAGPPPPRPTPAPYKRLLQGPLVGPPTADGVTVWTRTSGEFDLQLEYDTQWPFTNAQRTPVVRSRKSDDYVTVLRATGLQPATEYHYRVLVDGVPDRQLGPHGAFPLRTAPAGVGRFRVAFGSCARVELFPEQPIWRAIQRSEPDLFFWLGDNIYADTLDPDLLPEFYRQQRSVSDLLPVIRSVPQLAIWDDHDYALNDGDRRNPLRDGALAAFRRYWPNPSFGLPGTPGVFFKYGYGGVDFFFLDTRYHRDPVDEPDGPSKTALGPAQRQWLLDELARSTAPFKVLISGTGWTMAKGVGGDSWASFVHERNLIFNFLRDRRIGGVVLLSGDTHVGELNCVPWSDHGGYDLYDLVASPLAQVMNHNWPTRAPEVRIRPVYPSMPNAGVLDFDLTRNPATVSLSLINQLGHAVWAPVRLTTADLQNGVTSWEREAKG
jgi:alkaline phosphatase D